MTCLSPVLRENLLFKRIYAITATDKVADANILLDTVVYTVSFSKWYNVAAGETITQACLKPEHIYIFQTYS
jgi:hypothetical protein